MFVGANGPVSLQGMSPLKKSKADSGGPVGDKFEAGSTEWKPVKPSLQTEAPSSSKPLRGALGSILMLTLGVALSLGASGCASVATAHAAESGRPQIVQVDTAKTAKQETAKPSPAKQLSGQKKSTEQGTAYQVGRELNQAGKDVKEAAKPVLEKGKEVGKEIGKAGKDFGLGVAKEATSFWKGLTGK